MKPNATSPQDERDADEPRQLLLDLAGEPRFLPEDFIVGPSNERAYAMVEAWPSWPGEALLLVGPRGSGKTHLGAIWAGRAHAWTVRRAELAKRRACRAFWRRPRFSSRTRMSAAMRRRSSISSTPRSCAVRISCSPPSTSRRCGIWRRPIFCRGFVSRRRSISRSRTTSSCAWCVIKLFVDRQLVVDAGVVETILTHAERSFAGARAAVEMLDRHSLATQRRITRALAREVLREADQASSE